ncbi:MAG: ribonuclease E activity regulator RraA [Anaerolineae bacterium]|nr:ribonuclease E activity regulator RraA [Anaerolineae bacterium]
MSVRTADLCDQFGEEVQVLEPLFQDYGGVASFWGRIATVDVFEDNLLVREMLDRPGEGQVLVVDGGGSLQAALLGEELARLAQDNGWAGIVIYGSVRDVAGLAEIGIGIRALASTPRASFKRGNGACDLPLHFAGVGFRPPAYLYADEDGILVAPRDLLAEAE